ncbi:MAG: protein-glutamate O-methyltransferase CheR [Planctomycetota bacterium]
MTLSDDQFDRFQKLIYDSSGIRLESRKRSLLMSRLNRRLRVAEVSGVEDYLSLIDSPRGRSEFRQLIDAVTTNETSFFRTEEHFRWFNREFLFRVMREEQMGHRLPELSIWSAACSVGAEPYTMAMCLQSRMAVFKHWDIQILGTDISQDAIRQAKQGIFSGRMLQGVSATDRKRYFRQVSTVPVRFQLNSAIKEQAEFHTHNLLHPMLGSSFDCVFLRNVLIYFDAESKKRVLQNVASAVGRGGYLVVGPSEGVYGMMDGFQKIDSCIYRKLDPSTETPAAGSDSGVIRNE